LIWGLLIAIDNLKVFLLYQLFYFRISSDKIPHFGMSESLEVMDPPEISIPEGIVDTSMMGVENHSNETSAVVFSSGETVEAGPNAVASADLRLKPKKKKGLLMTTASGGGSVGNHGENTGRWTAEEHRLFLQGLEQHGKGWKKIASLIKSRTVVQIRTHAQKYFQKLAKARQNGEDEGAVTFMEGRGGAASTTSASTVVPRRRRQVTGTKRKTIQSIVASAQRQVKKVASATGVPDPMAVSIAPVLEFFVLPTETDGSGDGPELGNVTGPTLEDSLYVLSLKLCIIL
jgi:SHAQKYF class myb-like DNA-binding protein